MKGGYLRGNGQTEVGKEENRNSKENNRGTEDERRRGGGTFLIGRKLEDLKISEMIEK
mgnify:FL=1